MEKKIKILSFGSLNIDTRYSVPYIVRPGETMSSLSVDHYVGGKGLNQSIALSYAGGEVYHGGAVGEKDGDILIKSLLEAGVNVDNIVKKPGLSGNAFIQVGLDGQNSIILFDGANKKISSDEVDSILSHFSPGDYIVLQNEINRLPEIIEKAHSKGMVVFLNPSPFNDEIIKCDLTKLNWLLLNEIEAAQLSEEDRYSEGTLGLLKDKYKNVNMLITLGESGSICCYGDKVYTQDIFNVDVVDTTAAGDTYTGYFVAEFSESKDIQNAMKIASIASGLAVSRAGASNSIPRIKEVEKYI